MNAEFLKPMQASGVMTQGARPVAELTRVDRTTGRNELAEDGQVQPPEETGTPVAEEDVRQAVSNLNDYAQMLHRDLQFSVDEDSGRTVIKVIDSETNNVIRQIPSEQVLELARHFSSGEGLNLRERA